MLNRAAMTAVLGGVIFMVIGLILASTVIEAAVSAGTNPSIDSFTGAKSLNDLFPLVYYAILLSGSIGLLSVGGLGLAGRGPLGRG